MSDAFRNGLLAVLGGFEHVQKGIDAGRERKKQNTLAQLAGDYYAAPSQNGLSAIASVDPEAAARHAPYQQTHRQNAERRAGQIAGALVNAPPEMRAQLYQQHVAELERIGVIDLPDVWDEKLLPIASDWSQRFGGSGQGRPADLVEFDAMTDGFTPEEKSRARRVWAGLESRASSGLPFASGTAVGEDGRERVYRFNKRTGELEVVDSGVPAAGGGAAPNGSDPMGAILSSAANRMREAGMPEPDIDAWLSKQTGNGFQAPPGSIGAPRGAAPPRNGQGIDPLVSPTPGEVEYSKRYSGEMGEAAGKRDSSVVQRQTGLDATIRSIDSTLESVDAAIAKVPGFGTTGLAGAVASKVPGTPAYDLRQQIATVKANLGFDRLQAMRDASPTGGALGQVAVQELEYLQAAVASLDQAQTDQQLMAALEKVKRHYQNWRKAVLDAGQRSGLDTTRTPSPPAARTKQVEWIHGPDGKLMRREK
jgi:hypothetical protein